MFHLTFLGIGFLVLSFASVYAGPHEQAQRLCSILAGVPCTLAELRTMEDLISRGQRLAAASIPTRKDQFYNVTIRQWATPMMNREESVYGALTDSIATFIGVTRDDRDARELLTGNYVYQADRSVVGFYETSLNEEQQNCPFDGSPGRDGQVLFRGTDRCQYDTRCRCGQPIHSNYALLASNGHYLSIEEQKINLRRKLIRVHQRLVSDTSRQPPPQPEPGKPDFLAEDIPDSVASGVLTTRGWGYSHFLMGTNRRPVDFMFRAFLCSSIQEVRDGTAPGDFVRNDVSRAPAGSEERYRNVCAACHKPMDAAAGSMAYWDMAISDGASANFRHYLYYSGGAGPYQGVMEKIIKPYTQPVFPVPYVQDDSWVNYFTRNQNARLGWVGPPESLRGNGLQSFARMISESRGFRACMARRVFREVCKRRDTDDDSASIEGLAESFKTDGYNIRKLFERTAVLPRCIGN